jgi:transcriptional regulator with XRE-family HTH domain
MGVMPSTLGARQLNAEVDETPPRMEDGGMKIEELIGSNVKQAREIAHLTQAEFGERVGDFLGKAWVPQAVSQAEKGRRDWAILDLAAVAYALHRPITWFLQVPSGADPKELLEVPGDVELSLEGVSLGTAAELSAEQLLNELGRVAGDLRFVIGKGGFAGGKAKLDAAGEVEVKE